MPKVARELNAMQIARLKTDGSYTVGGVPGLYLRVEGNSRAWVLRYVAAGQRRRMGLGNLAAVSLAQARELARVAQGHVRDGQDPIDQRRAGRRSAALAQAKVLTFKTACEKFIAAKEHEWRNPKHRLQWVNTLATYAEPVIGALDVAEIQTADVQRVLDPIWLTKTETATRLRGRIEQVLDWATVRGSRSGDNPARWRGHLDHLLPRPSKIAKVTHHPAVDVAGAPALVSRIRAAAGQSTHAMLLQILTACRSGEVLGARWDEIDLDQALWIIPAGRMKAGREHRVPLSRQALELLRAQPVIARSALVFPSSKLHTPLSNRTLTALLRRLKAPCVPHGWRSTFRDWAAETTHYPGEVVEMALAHAISDKTEAAYRRGDLLVKRAALMQDWADYCMRLQS
jgi:integrase